MENQGGKIYQSKMKKLILIMFAVFLSFSFVSAITWDNTHYYKLDETTGAVIDELGTKHGINHGVTRGVSGLIGSAFEWDGVDEDDYVNLTDVYDGSTNFSVSLWIKTSYSGDNYVFANSWYPNFMEWRILGTGSSIEVTEKNSTGDEAKVTGTKNVNDGNWHHIVVTWDNSNTNLSLYIDNEFQGSDNTGSIISDPGGNWILGLRDKGVGFQQEWNGSIDEVGLWGRLLDRSEIEELYNSGSGLSYEEKSFVYAYLEFPPDNYLSSETSIDFLANYSTIRCNLTNATLYIWNSTLDLINKTTQTITGTSNSSNFTISGFTLGSYKWNVLACGENATGSLCNFATSNRTFEIGASLSSITYNNKTYETAEETFIAEFNILEGAEISLAQLVYNGTNYTISNLTYPNSTYLILTKTMDMALNPSPFQNTTNDFFFRFIYAGNQVQETSTFQQDVGYINFKKCNATFSTTALNFTYRDEFDNSEINASKNSTSMEVTFHYWLGSGSIYKNYSFQNLSMSDSQVKFCIFPSHLTFKTDMDMDYEATDYSLRQYYFRNAVLTNQTREIPLILLLTEYSVKFFITLKQGTDFFTDGIVTISKYFTGEGDYKTISIRKSDDKGEFIEYFDLDKNYKFSIVKDGVSYGTIEKWITCQEAPCTLTLDLEDVTMDIWQGYYDYFATNIAYNLTYNDDTKLVTFIFNDLTGLAQYFRLEVLQTKYNETSATVCDKTLYTTAGTLTCNLTDYEGQFTAKAYVSRIPEKFVDYINFAISTIKEILGRPLSLFITLILIVTIALIGAWNPAVGVALIAFSILMMTIVGFTPFSYATVVAVMIIALVLIIKMRT